MGASRPHYTISRNLLKCTVAELISEGNQIGLVQLSFFTLVPLVTDKPAASPATSPLLIARGNKWVA